MYRKSQRKAPSSELMHIGQCWLVIVASLPYLFLSRWKGSGHCCLEMLRYLAPETTSCECSHCSKWSPQTRLEQAWKTTGTSPQPHLTCGQGRGRSLLLSSWTENVEGHSMCSFRKGHKTQLAFGVGGYLTLWKSLDKSLFKLEDVVEFFLHYFFDLTLGVRGGLEIQPPLKLQLRDSHFWVLLCAGWKVTGCNLRTLSNSLSVHLHWGCCIDAVGPGNHIPHR